jgi:hypothetical protein
MISQLKNKIFIILLTCSVVSCVSLKRMQNKKLFRDANKICEICNENYSRLIMDTISIENDFICVFKTNELQEAGKVKSGVKLGKWYTFSEGSKVKEVVNFHRKGKDSVTLYRSYMGNESW